MSLVSESITALKAMMDATVGAAGVPTYVGNPAGQGDLPDAYGAVAYGGDDRPGIIGGRGRDLAYGNDTIGDRWFVWCTISKASGDSNPAVLLDAVEDLLDLFDTALRADIHLGSLLKADGRADMATHEWTVEDAGNIVTVFFQIDVIRRW